MIDIVFIHPGAQHGIYGPLGETLTALEPPRWALILASYFVTRGHDVKVIDQEAERLNAEAVAQQVLVYAPRLVCIVVHGHQPSASTQQMVAAHDVAVWLKHEHVTSPVVMLGNHPSALPERTLREEPVDFVIDGEGPVALEGLLEYVKKYGHQLRVHAPLSEISGLVWQKELAGDVSIVHNPLPPLLDMDRDLAGSVAWHLLDMTRYRAHNWQCLGDWPREPYASIHTTLGCSFRCNFCMINVFQHTNKYRRRSPENVVKEIVYLYRDHGVRTFKFTDELFVLNRNHYREICQGLAGLGDQINIWAYARTDSPMDGFDLELMRRGGIRWLALGIESGSADVRGGANKALKGDAGGNGGITATVAKIRAAGINVIGNYIFGLPDDTLESMEQTLDLALELNTEWANFYCAMPYPGSPLYDEVARDRPQDLPPSWSAYSQHNRHSHPLRNKNLTAAQIIGFRDGAFRTYFSSSDYRAMLAAKFGPSAIEEVDRMLSYNLDRDLLKEPTP